MKIVRLRRSKVKFSSAYKKRTYQETFECCCILHYWDRQFRTSTEITTSMKIEITRDVELIAQQVSITCYFYFHRCCNLWWVRRGFFWIINLSVMCQYRYQKHAFYRSANNYVCCCKKNNIFWIIALCYSYIFHDLKRCPYALEMKKQI